MIVSNINFLFQKARIFGVSKNSRFSQTPNTSFYPFRQATKSEMITDTDEVEISDARGWHIAEDILLLKLLLECDELVIPWTVTK
jgi:hypothetical protein